MAKTHRDLENMWSEDADWRRWGVVAVIGTEGGTESTVPGSLG
jgi:hypothetical protein